MEALILLLFLPLVSCLHLLAPPEERALLRREREANRLYAATWGQLFGATGRGARGPVYRGEQAGSATLALVPLTSAQRSARHEQLCPIPDGLDRA